MSEPKRVPLQTLEFANAAKKDKGKQLMPSHRFTLTLPESNEKTCPEFDYAQLLKAAEVSKIKKYHLHLRKLSISPAPICLRTPASSFSMTGLLFISA